MQEIRNLAASIKDEIQKGADNRKDDIDNVGNKCLDHTPNTIHNDTFEALTEATGLTSKEILKEANTIHNEDA